MRKRKVFQGFASQLCTTLVTLLMMWELAGCKKEEVAVGPLTLVSLSADGANLLDQNNTTTVAVTTPISAVFSTDIDPTTITDTSVIITRDYDMSPVPLILILSRADLSVKSTGDLLTGAYYTLQFTSAIKNKNGDPLAPYTVKFKTVGNFVPADLVAYWSFEKSPVDIVGTLDPDPNLDVADITYVPGRNTTAGYAASFNGTTSIIQTPPASSSILTAEVTVSFWMYLNSVEHTTTSGKMKNSYVLGLGNSHGLSFTVDSSYQSATFSQGYFLQNNATLANEFQFEGNGITSGSPAAGTGIENASVFNQSIGMAGIQSLLDNKWAHVVMTFKDTVNIRSLYINGELMYQQDLTLLSKGTVDPALQPLATVSTLKFIPDVSIPATYDDKLAFGFWQGTLSTYGAPSGAYSNPDANHFKGLLDDIRFFNRALTAQEIKMMYDGDNK